MDKWAEGEAAFAGRDAEGIGHGNAECAGEGVCRGDVVAATISCTVVARI